MIKILVTANTVILVLVVALVIIPHTEITQILSSLPTAWGTMIGAIIGLFGVAYTANRGFSNLIRAQEHRAIIETEARNHQARLNLNAKILDDKNRANALAYGLAAELSVLAHDIEVEADKKRSLAEIVRKLGPKSDKELRRFHTPKWRTAVYDANITGLGAFGPSIAGDIYLIYSKYTGTTPGYKSEPIEYETFLRISESSAKELIEEMQDITHVHGRIMSYVMGQPDPGPLWATEKARRRREAKLGKEQADQIFESYSRSLNSKPMD